MTSLARAAMAKYFATTTAIEVTNSALNLSGGFGFLKGSPIERHYRDVRGGPFHPPRNMPTALSLAGRLMLGFNLDPNLKLMRSAQEPVRKLSEQR